MTYRDNGQFVQSTEIQLEGSMGGIATFRPRINPIHTTPPTLLERLRTTTDEAAWRRLVQLYTPLLFTWARRCGESEHDAADLVQEVFAVLVQTLPAFRYDRTDKLRAGCAR